MVIWIAIFGGIALAGVAMLVGYGVWLAHKAADVLSEVTVLADRGGQLADLLGQIRVPDPGPEQLPHSGRAVPSAPAVGDESVV